MGINEIIEIGKRMKKLRIDAGVTQKEMADRLNLSSSTYSNYENGYREPKMNTISDFCKKLDIQVDELIKYGFTDAPTDIPKNAEVTKKYYQQKNSTIISHFEKLNDSGQDKAIEQVDLLTKIPEFQRDKKTR